MSGNISSPSPMQPLSVGNVVSAGLRIYRSHLKSYFLLALIGYLWLFVPFLFSVPAGMVLYWSNNSGFVRVIVGLIQPIVYFYCLGKFSVNAAIISRLAFGELVNQPETVNAARSQVKPRLWMFVLTVLLLGVIYFLLLLFLGILVVLLQLLLWGQPLNLSILVNIPTFFVVLAAILWFFARFFIANTLIGIEDGLNPVTTISRSWDLSKGNAWRIILILSVSLLITTLLQIVILSIALPIIQLLPQSSIPDAINGSINANAIFFIAIGYLLILLLLFLINAVILPFWQSIKAVVYYDLRSRREGLGLKLRDREI